MIESGVAGNERATSPRRLRVVRNMAALVIVLLGLATLAAWILTQGQFHDDMQPVAAATSAAVGAPFAPYSVPRPLPDIAFRDAEGQSRSLAEFRGRVVLLNLWATWCAPCRAEMPTLDRLQARLGGKDFEVVALSIDREGPPIVKRFFDETKVHALRIYVDSGMDAQNKLGAIGIPTTVLIDSQGREVARKTGPAEWDRPEIVKVIEQYIPARRAQPQS